MYTRLFSYLLNPSLKFCHNLIPSHTYTFAVPFLAGVGVDPGVFGGVGVGGEEFFAGGGAYAVEHALFYCFADGGGYRPLGYFYPGAFVAGADFDVADEFAAPRGGGYGVLVCFAGFTNIII